MSDPRAWLDQVDARTNAAKAGPWYRQDGNAIPGPRWTGQPEWFIDSDATLIAYSPIDKPDAEFIAHARTDLPAMSAALRAVLDLHAADEYSDCIECSVDTYASWPCATIKTITTALEGV